MGDLPVRIAVLVLGLIAAAGAGVGGVAAMIALDQEKEKAASAEAKAKAPPTQSVRWEVELAVARDAVRLGQLLMILYLSAAGLGVFASFLAFTRRRFTAAAMFLVVAVAPVVAMARVVDEPALTLVFTGALALPALLSLFIGSAPPPKPVG
jgi:hypothetical protein